VRSRDSLDDDRNILAFNIPYAEARAFPAAIIPPFSREKGAASDIAGCEFREPLTNVINGASRSFDTSERECVIIFKRLAQHRAGRVRSFHSPKGYSRGSVRR